MTGAASYPPARTVLLIGGASGTGKSTVAHQLGLQPGIPWLQVDDLRLALERSRVTLPENTAALYFFPENRMSGSALLNNSAMHSLP